jgi:hypothetical protein
VEESPSSPQNSPTNGDASNGEALETQEHAPPATGGEAAPALPLTEVPSAPQPATPSQPVAGPTAKSVEERKAALAQAVAEQIAQGYRVESQSDFQAVVVKGKRPNHLLHLILSLITLGVWLIVWITLSLTMHVHRRIVEVNEFANTTVRHVKN